MRSKGTYECARPDPIFYRKRFARPATPHAFRDVVSELEWVKCAHPGESGVLELELERLGFGQLDLAGGRLARHAEADGLIGRGDEGGGAGFSVAPFDINDHAAAGAQAGDRTGRPDLGQCGEQADFAGVALKEDFGDAGGDAEVAVDLDRRVGGPQVGEGVVGEQAGDAAVGAPGLAEASPPLIGVENSYAGEAQSSRSGPRDSSGGCKCGFTNASPESYKLKTT